MRSVYLKNVFLNRFDLYRKHFEYNRNEKDLFNFEQSRKYMIYIVYKLCTKLAFLYRIIISEKLKITFKLKTYIAILTYCHGFET